MSDSVLMVTAPTAEALTATAIAFRIDTAPAPVEATILPIDRVTVTDDDDIARMMHERISGVSTVTAPVAVAAIAFDTDFRTVTTPLADIALVNETPLRTLTAPVPAGRTSLPIDRIMDTAPAPAAETFLPALLSTVTALVAVTETVWLNVVPPEDGA